MTVDSLVQPDIYTAVYDYISIFADPQLNPNNIIRGWQNRSYLPQDTNEYSVITIIDSKRIGTNVHQWSEDPNISENLIIKELELVGCSVQIDFCSDDDSSEQRARTIELITRSEIGVNFFSGYNISPLYAETPKDMSFTDGSEQFVKRFMVMIHLNYWINFSTSNPSFSTYSLTIENVDVEHPIQ